MKKRAKFMAVNGKKMVSREKKNEPKPQVHYKKPKFKLNRIEKQKNIVVEAKNVIDCVFAMLDYGHTDHTETCQRPQKRIIQ
jgi:hypothetical protein